MGKSVRRSVVIPVVVGAYLIAMGFFLRFWAYDRVAVVPRDQNTAQILVAKNARFFDADHVKEATGTITVNYRVIANPDKSKSVSKEMGKQVVVMKMGQSADNNTTPPPIDYQTEEFAIARHGSQAVDWPDATENDEDTQFKGYVIKFPFNTQKKSYQYWDTFTQQPMTMKYQGVRTVKGTTGSIKTYLFEGTVPRTVFTTREVPRGIFGLPDTGGVNADRSFQVVRKIWVEPQTGVFMKLEEDQQQYLTINEKGAKQVAALVADLKFTPATIQSNINEYKTKAFLLRFVRVYGPIGFGLIGVVLIGAAVGLARRDADSDAQAGHRGRKGKGQREESELTRT